MAGAGARDCKIEFLRRAVSRDAMNGQVDTWPVLTWALAERSVLSDSEQVRAKEVAAAMTDRFRVPWTRTLAAVDPKHRIRRTDPDTGKAFEYDIVGVKPLGRRRELEFTAAARAEQ